MIEKRGGSGGRGGERGRNVEKNVLVMKCNKNAIKTLTYHIVENTYQWILNSVALLV